jgi:hypothetical protein
MTVCVQVPKPLAPQELDQLKQEIAAELQVSSQQHFTQHSRATAATQHTCTTARLWLLNACSCNCTKHNVFALSHKRAGTLAHVVLLACRHRWRLTLAARTYQETS